MMGSMDTSLQIRVPEQDRSLLDDVEALDALDVRRLHPGDTLLLQTSHSEYRLRLVDPGRGKAWATGSGKFLNDESPVRLLGATLSGRGSMVRLGVVMPGFKVVLQLSEGELMTSKVRRIFVNGVPMDPSTRVH
jgi:hypothetical protein